MAEAVTKKRSVVSTIGRGVFLLVAGVVLFDIPAAYVAARGFSPWLSLAAGLLSFPVLALAWHVFGELARKRAQGQKGKKPPLTTGWERWVMRSGAVGLTVIAGLIALDKGVGGVWNAARHHALWFLPDGAGSLEPDSKLFDHVPPNAEGIVWVRLDDEARAAIGKVVPVTGSLAKAMEASEFVVAGGDKGLMLAERGDAGAIAFVQEMLAGLEEVAKEFAPMMLLPRGIAATMPDGTRTLVSEAWKDEVSKGRPDGLIELMRRAPSDAFIVVVTRPKVAFRSEISKSKAKELAGATIWARVHRGRLGVYGRVDFESPAAAEAAREELRKVLAKQDEDNCWKRYVHAESSASGATVDFSVWVNVDELEAAVTCVKSAK